MMLERLDYNSEERPMGEIKDSMDQPPRTASPGLHERRRRRDQSREPVNFSQIRRPRVVCDAFLVPGGQMTPPETPVEAREQQASATSSAAQQYPEHQEHEPPVVFHNYLRAFCSFDPNPSQTAEDHDLHLQTARLQRGDLILVHSIHVNGWADGTVLSTGARGWLPTNYCESFDHLFLRPLLNAMTQFWDLLGEGNLGTFIRQDYIRGLIAGVRALLEQADCLHRDGTVVQRHAGVRRMRKGLLADLSSLVQIAKRLQETISESFADEVLPVLLDELKSKAFKVVTRAMGFVDVWAQETMDERRRAQVQNSVAQSPVTPPAEDATLTIDTDGPMHRSLTPAIDSGKHFISTPTLDTSKQAPSDHMRTGSDQRSSKIFRPRTSIIAHRMSLIQSGHSSATKLASEQLCKAYDICISHIGTFTGLYIHPHPRPACELKATTKRLVHACEDMLSIVDQVCTHNPQRLTAVRDARAHFELKLDHLVHATADVFRFSDGAEDDVCMMPEQRSHLVDVGTSIIRTVRDCVDKTRQLIESTGDFELERPVVDGEAEDGEQDQASSGANASVEQQHVNDPLTTPVSQKLLPKQMLPPAAPPPKSPKTASVEVADFAFPAPPAKPDLGSPMTPTSMTSSQSIPAAAKKSQPIEARPGVTVAESLTSPHSARTDSLNAARDCSFGTSLTGSVDTQKSSVRNSGNTTVSEGSTRATTPDQGKEVCSPDAALINSFASLSSLRSAANTEASFDTEAQLLHKTYAGELTLNKDGQVTGGSLPALVEQLTPHDSAPDPQFVSAFFITFRHFAAPRELSQALMHRFDYIGDGKTVGTPVRLRVYNVFKGWLETYWNAEADRDALGDIRFFALHRLRPHLPSAGDRLVELTRRLGASYHTGLVTGPLVSGVGKTSMSIGMDVGSDSARAPEPIISKSQLNMLRSAITGATTCTVMDFDPLEMARQLTLLPSRIFCEIQTEELLSLDWGNKTTSRARNVRNLCILNTDLAHVVGDTILSPDDARRRAAVIKHWSKIAKACLDLSNYESLMAIMCSLNSSVVQRLRKTWEHVTKRTRARLDELNAVVDVSRKAQASLRRRLETAPVPCLPFLGIYLTDLTFLDAAGPKTRDLPGTATSVINFDKHMRMAKIVSHLQKYQVPYKLQPVPELQTWIEEYLHRMREGSAEMVGHFHRRSLLVEPKLPATVAGAPVLDVMGTSGRTKASMPLQEQLPPRRNTEPGDTTMAEACAAATANVAASSASPSSSVLAGAEDPRPRTSSSAKSAPQTKTSETFEFFLRSMPFKSRTTEIPQGSKAGGQAGAVGKP